MQAKQQRNRVAVLNALRHAGGPTTSARLAEMLAQGGRELSERTLRLYLGQLDAEGLTQAHGRRGRTITESGLREIRAARALERVGYLSARIDQMTYRMTFDLPLRSGLVVVNSSVLSPQRLAAALDRIGKVFARGYAMGNRAALLGPGERLGELVVPADRICFCTVCSVTLNGVLLKHGVPTTSRFGGLLELRDHQPTRFVEMIHYDGTSIDPLEVFIRSGMTDYHGAIRDGNGLIGASYREVPEESQELVKGLADQLRSIGLGAFMRIGAPGQSVLGLPASEGRIGLVVVGGLNPIAILEESGQRIESRALSGLMEFNRLVPYTELAERLQTWL